MCGKSSGPVCRRIRKETGVGCGDGAYCGVEYRWRPPFSEDIVRVRQALYESLEEVDI